MSPTNDCSAPADDSLSPLPTQADGELLRRLAGCLAHHVNNSLTGVIGYLELALRDLSPRTPVAAHLHASLACAFQAASAVKRIVTFACRPEDLPLRQPLSLAAVVEQVAERLRGPGQPSLTIETAAAGPCWVLTSEPALLAALQQVTDNAVEAMPEGGTLRLRVEESEGWCLLVVADTGGGIAPEMLPHLFEPFHTTKTSGHLGLGLVQCRDLMRLLGGRLDVDTVAGQGTTVTLALPALTRDDRFLDDCTGRCLGPAEAHEPGCFVN